MDFPDIPYFKITKILLSMLGIWPYQKPLIRYCIGGTAILIVIISITPVYWLSFYKTLASGDVNATMEVIPAYTMLLASQIKLFNLFFYTKNFKKLLDLIKNDRNNMTSERDKRILLDYEKFSKKMILYYFVYCYVSLLIFGVSATAPKILDVIIPLNESRPNYDLFYIEYYVDKEKYYKTYSIHTLIVGFGVTSIAIANDSLEFIYVQHVCMKFTILGQRVKNIMQEGNDYKLNICGCTPNYNKLERKETKIEEINSENIILCIKEHQRIIEYANLVKSVYSTMLALIVIVIMAGVFITGFEVVKNLNRLPVASKNATLLFGKLVHVYVQTWIGQRLLDHCNRFNDSIYKSPWFQLTNKKRRLMLMLFLRNQKPCKITAGILCDMSMETFKTIVMTSMSYFTALNSLY